ncbi:MAG TPA: FAD-dependent oxidoreductase [Roseimicrobium sp.]|nr:FAD-dependent oxidoreductase [Roseimicrobium sp.]
MNLVSLFRRILLLIAVFTLTAGRLSGAQFDVLVYGATPGGIAAALAAAKDGSTVALIEPTAHVGGLMTSGLSHTDFHAFEGLTGSYLEFCQTVQKHYDAKYGPDSAQAKSTFRGAHTEPSVNELVLEQMIAAQKQITLIKRSSLVSVSRATTDGKQGMALIASATFTTSDGKRSDHTASVFIDGTYEGDLMAKAGVAYRVGREGRAEYGESLAPEAADKQLQAYNFRLTMTTNAVNRVTPSKPPGYNRADFVDLLPLLKDGRIKSIFRYDTSGIFKAQPPSLPNDKVDINDISRGPVRLSMPGHNLEWPEGDDAARRKIYAEHVRYNVGLLYFIQNDESVPATFRDEARLWGFCKDEFADNGHIPYQLYVREARRMTGVHVYKESDMDVVPGDSRAVLHTNAIAMGEYGPNCHGTFHEGPLFGGKHTGEFYKPVPPYQIPYGVLLPKEVGNLLVPVAVSSTHVGFCALRLEPIWMSLGQAAGHAASLSLKSKTPLRGISIPALQDRLHKDGSATIYLSDVLPGSKYFKAAQWFGTRGAFHGLVEYKGKVGQRGEKIISQYTKTYAAHDVEPAKVIDEALLSRWIGLLPASNKSRAISDKSLKADGTLTRGEALLKLYPYTRLASAR